MPKQTEAPAVRPTGHGPHPFKRGDRVIVQDKTLHPTPSKRKGTVEEYLPGDPNTVQINMDNGSRMHTLAENVTLKTAEP